MATRSTIALEFEDGTVKQIYAHWDGYLEGNGEILLKHYKAPADVAALIDMGDLSSLDTTLEATTFYARDRGETDVDAREFSDINDYKRNGDFQSYNYIMREGVWHVDRGEQGELITLIEAFRLQER
jgi:hypothetical protein